MGCLAQTLVLYRLIRRRNLSHTVRVSHDALFLREVVREMQGQNTLCLRKQIYQTWTFELL